MRNFLVAALVALALPAAGAQAQSRPDSNRLTCVEARNLVLRSGAIVLGSGPYVYERYVATAGFCSASDATQRAFAPTRDEPMCHVGERCVPRGHMIAPGR